LDKKFGEEFEGKHRDKEGWGVNPSKADLAIRKKMGEERRAACYEMADGSGRFGRKTGNSWEKVSLLKVDARRVRILIWKVEMRRKINTKQSKKRLWKKKNK